MAPFEALYGRKCRTPLFWNQIDETQVFVPDVLSNVEEQVRMIRDNLRVAVSTKKLCQHLEKRVELQSGWLCVFESVTDEECEEI